MVVNDCRSTVKDVSHDVGISTDDGTLIYVYDVETEAQRMLCSLCS